MSQALVLSFLLYAFVTAITPGPANLSSLAASLHFGKAVALRQWRGLFVGYAIVALMAVFVVYFVGTAFNEYIGYLSWIGAAYILWLAYHILTAGEISNENLNENNPALPSFKTGLFVQLTNVKIMVSCMTILSVYVLPNTNSFWILLAVGMFLPFTGPIMNLIWLFAGVAMKELFSKHRKMVDTVMAVSLAYCAFTLVFPM